MSLKSSPIKALSISGFKSIELLDNFELRDLNVLIGANGVGKSNFISYFQMLRELCEQRLQLWAARQGGADRVLSYGVKKTNRLETDIKFGRNGYSFSLVPTADSGLTFQEERLFFDGPRYGPTKTALGAGHLESQLKSKYEEWKEGSEADFVYSSISSWRVFHFHDTSDTAGVKRRCAVHDSDYLRSDASNLAAYLYFLQQQHPQTYKQIRQTVALAIPFFDDFVLRPTALPTGEEQIQLLWKQKDSDYALWPSQLSDGSIRFICLATALLQPTPPSTIIIDEPELGLHPYALVLLGSMIRSASKRMQIIISTQSVPLLNEFTIDDLIVVERQDGASTFCRYKETEFQTWLEDYSVGELWEKNILGGRPQG